jgi:MtN3 and saliva related transmembrane protein
MPVPPSGLPPAAALPWSDACRKLAASHDATFLPYVARTLIAEHPLPIWTEIVGSVAATLTTFCWLPQIIKILRDRRTDDISLATTSVLATGVFLWIIYGFALGSMPVIAANIVSFLFVAAIVVLKLRYG